MKVRKGKMIECSEEYTSKTCGGCGRLNHSLGSKKVFECSHCKIVMDRDINAARNIFIKNYQKVKDDVSLHITGNKKAN